MKKYLVLLCITSLVLGLANAEESQEQGELVADSVSVNVCQLSELSGAEQAEPLPSIEILFYEKDETGDLVPCSLSGVITVRPAEMLSGSISSDKGAAWRLSNRAANDAASGVKFSVVKDDSNSMVKNPLIAGDEYILWSREYKKIQSFTVPESMSTDGNYSIKWIVNDGEYVEDILEHTQLLLQGNVESSYFDKNLYAQYTDKSNNWQVALINDGILSIPSLSLDGLGGYFEVFIDDQPVFVTTNVTDTILCYPGDEDFHFNTVEKKTCKIYIKNSSGNLKKVRGIGVFVSETCEANVIDPIMLSPSESHDWTVNSEHSVYVKINPGKYWAVIAGDGGRNILGKKEIEVKAEEGAENVFTIDIDSP